MSNRIYYSFAEALRASERNGFPGHVHSVDMTPEEVLKHNASDPNNVSAKIQYAIASMKL